MINEKTLKQCPWCKNERLTHFRGEVGNLHWVHCHQCCADGPAASSWNEAQDLWNFRGAYDFQDEAKEIETEEIEYDS